MPFVTIVSKMGALWHRLGVQVRLHILIQGALLLFFILSHQWIISRFEMAGIRDAESQASELADGLINGLNMLMVTGKISNPSNRVLLVKKMQQSKNVLSVHVIRADQVKMQFGPGLPEEQRMDADIERVIASKIPAFKLNRDANGVHVLRAIVPYIASTNFRGTNCLSCHNVKNGSVNGAADIKIDLTELDSLIARLNYELWIGMAIFQIILSIVLSFLVSMLLRRHISAPVKHLHTTMQKIHETDDLSMRVSVDGKHPDVDDMARTFNSFVSKLEVASHGISLFAKVVENSEEAILITDASCNIVFVNQAFEKITGYLSSEVIGRNPRILKSGRQEDSFYKQMWSRIAAEGSWQGEIWNRKKNGEIYPEWQSISTVKNANGEVTNYVSIFLDITQRKEAEAYIQHMANYDALTGLANRNLLNDRFSQAILHANRNGLKVAVLFIDLDGFKDVNDSLGHESGDDLLKIVAARIVGCVRDEDTVARQGGDEFIVLLSELEESENVSVTAQKILACISQPICLGDTELFVSASIGISVYPDDGDENRIFKNADAAMYSAKGEGKNRFHYFTEGMNESVSKRIKISAGLRGAIARAEMMVCYQPQVNTISGEITGLEALLRWRHPALGNVSPAQFIPIAESSGLIVSIGEWVLKEACQEARNWHLSGRKIKISVNVSARQFKEGNLFEVVEQALLDSGLEPAFLELEVTEGILIDHTFSTIETMNRLKELGVTIALDDFGTGYSSLSYIKKFPIDRIKIDQSFVRDILTDQEDAAIVDAVIYIAHNLDLKVIAEGVETKEQMEFLIEHKCEEAQGYLISEPLNHYDLARFMASRTTKELIVE